MSKNFDETKDYYATLDLAGTADNKAIRAAYHRLALSLHPDKTGSHATTEDTADLNEAYRVLSNDSLRKQYNGRRVRHAKQRLYGTSVTSFIDRIKSRLPSSGRARGPSPDAFTPEPEGARRLEPQIESRSSTSTRPTAVTSSAPPSTPLIATLADATPVSASTPPPASARGPPSRSPSRSPRTQRPASCLVAPSRPVSPPKSASAPRLPPALPTILPTLVPASPLTIPHTSAPASPPPPPASEAPPSPRSAPPPTMPKLGSLATPSVPPLVPPQARPPASPKQTLENLGHHSTSDTEPASNSLARPIQARKRTTRTSQCPRDAKIKHDERVQKRKANTQAKSRTQRLLRREQTKELALLQPTAAKNLHKKGRNKRAKKSQEQLRKRRGSEASWDGDRR